jgi:hypothetical protein
LDTKFVAPEIKDYGTLTELTAAVGIAGAEDGASKALLTSHVLPSLPLGP